MHRKSDLLYWEIGGLKNDLRKYGERKFEWVDNFMWAGGSLNGTCRPKTMILLTMAGFKLNK